MGSQSDRDLLVWQKGIAVVLDGLSDLLVLPQERVVRLGGSDETGGVYSLRISLKVRHDSTLGSFSTFFRLRMGRWRNWTHNALSQSSLVCLDHETSSSLATANNRDPQDALCADEQIETRN